MESSKKSFVFIAVCLGVAPILNNQLLNSLLTLNYGLALFPILVVLILMTALRWGGQHAGPLGWLMGLYVAFIAFGLNLEIFWVSQLKGILLSVFVLWVIWPALFLFNVVDQAGGIQAISKVLEQLITDRGILLIVVAWAFSGMFEGLAGFGLPIAIVAPMLVRLGTPPIIAVASVAIGHAWSVTFGDMGVVFQTLIALVNVNAVELAGNASLILGIACLLCGLAAAIILKQGTRWPVVLVLALIMSFVQYGFAISNLSALAAFFAGFSGVVGGWFLNKFTSSNQHKGDQSHTSDSGKKLSPQLGSALASYGLLTVLMSVIAVVKPINNYLADIAWSASFPQVTSLNGFITDPGTGQGIRPFVHPGTAMLFIAMVSILVNKKMGLTQQVDNKSALIKTWKSAKPATIGIISMVGLSTLMDHTGMTLLLAEGFSNLFGRVFPIISPLVGMLGAFATGSNNNSNVLFASLQENVAHILKLSPTILIAAQTAGGSLGSMFAPAKIFVGCATVGLFDGDGDVLRITLPFGLVIGVGLGLVTLIFSL